MIVLYHRGGALDFDLISPRYDKRELEVLKFNVAKILTTRGEEEAAQFLKKIPFVIYNGVNHFMDEFCVLHTEVPLELYEELRAGIDQSLCASIARCISEIGPYIRFVSVDLKFSDPKTQNAIDIPTPQVTSDIVYTALADAEQLITSRGATSGIDRMHTALHGYLKFVCEQSNIEVSKNASITYLFKIIREKHPSFSDLGPRTEDITKVLKALATVIDSLNPIRNHASVAHPNEFVLDEPEATLVINAVRTLLSYFEARIKNSVNKV